MPRRKPGTLVALETEILEAALALLRSGHGTFHGFGLAHTMREHGGSRALTGHGTLYKALGRLEGFGMRASRWEDADAAEGRPRRRLYELTDKGSRRPRPCGPRPRPAHRAPATSVLELLGLNTMFIALFCGAAVLFRRGAR